MPKKTVVHERCSWLRTARRSIAALQYVCDCSSIFPCAEYRPGPGSLTVVAIDMTPNSEGEPQLRRNSLGLPELVFQGVTHIAPATNVVFTFPIIALKAGPVMPLSFLLSMIVCFFIGNTVSQFSRYVPSSGGYYSFATRGLGNRSGFMATWSYLIYEILGAAGSTGFLGYLISDMLRAQFHVNIPWWSFALVTTVLVWALTYHGIQLSAQITTLLGGLELLIMLAL